MIMMGDNMKRNSLICVIIFVIPTVVSAARAPRPVEITIYPSKATEVEKQYRLLPNTEELIDADAVPLYEKAIQSLSDSLDSNQMRDQIRQWLDIPLDEFPVQQVQKTLDSFGQIIRLIEQAAKCKQCNWPYVDPDEGAMDLSKYRILVYIMGLKARLEIQQGKYEQALNTTQISLAMGRNLCKSSNLIHGLVGVALVAFSFNRIEDLMQLEEGPNLYWALQALPRPFMDLTEQTELESPDARTKVTTLTNRANRHIAVLQCIEAMRLYAGAHDGKFPDKLSDIVEFSIPDDPVTKKPFSYVRTDSQAVLEAEATKDSEGRDAVHYEITFKNQD